MGVAYGDPIFAKVGTKICNFEGFYQNIFRTTGFQLKLLISIEFLNIFYWKPAKKFKAVVVLRQNLGQAKRNVVKKSKETGIIKKFFSYFTLGIPFKVKIRGCSNT